MKRRGNKQETYFFVESSSSKDKIRKEREREREREKKIEKNVKKSYMCNIDELDSNV